MIFAINVMIKGFFNDECKEWDADRVRPLKEVLARSRKCLFENVAFRLKIMKLLIWLNIQLSLFPICENISSILQKSSLD